MIKAELIIGMETSHGGDDMQLENELTVPAEVLEREIASETSGRIRDLKIENRDGYIILCGRTTTYYAKQVATKIALSKLGDSPFENAIEVV